MSKRIKDVSTVIISFVIMLMLFAIFVLFFNDSQEEKIQYIFDDANTCEWDSDVIISSTEAFDDNLEIVEVRVEAEGSYRNNASASGYCAVRVGDTAGSYATQLNEQYERQEQ